MEAKLWNSKGRRLESYIGQPFFFFFCLFAVPSPLLWQFVLPTAGLPGRGRFHLSFALHCFFYTF